MHVHASDDMDGNEAQRAQDLYRSRPWWHAATCAQWAHCSCRCDIVRLQASHRRGWLFETCVTAGLPCGAYDLPGALMNLSALVNPGLLGRAVALHPIHELWGAQSFGAGLA